MLLADYSQTGPFNTDTSFLIAPELYPPPCNKQFRWKFDEASMYTTPYPFSTQGEASSSAPSAPRMADGRQYTDYRPRCVTQLNDRKPMSSSYDHRQARIHNADAIMKHERLQAHHNVRCPSKSVTPHDTMLPEQDRFVCDKVTCERYDTAFPCTGLGTGRMYTTDAVSR